MIGLSDSQFEILEGHLTASGLHQKGLYDDLLDHYYCLTERYMQEGLAFEPAAQKALAELAPDGFETIENELISLLTFNFQINMKRFLFAGGFVSTFVVSLAFLFRMLHWPGANALWLTGLSALLFMSVVVLGINLMKKRGPASPEKTRISLGIVTTIFLCIGFLFKLMHWPGANLNILLGFIILCFVFLPLFFWQLYQKSVRDGAV